MRCLYCSFEDTKVSDSRTSDEGGSIRRRRVCERCSNKFTTYERVELPNMVVIKRDGTREPFDRHKIYRSFVMALAKNPEALNRNLEIGMATRWVEETLLRNGVATVTSKSIGELVMQKLKEMDVIAYLRFALVYKHYTGLDEIKEEIEVLSKSTTIEDTKEENTETLVSMI